MGFFDAVKKEVTDFVDTVSNAKAAWAPLFPGATNQYHPIYVQLEKNCKALKTDLVEATSHGCTCALCSSLEGRVFSLHGKDKRFPLLPEEVKYFGGFHEGCRHGFFPFIYGVDTLSNGKKDPVQFSNRPYKDYRTKQEREEYEAEAAKAAAQARARAEYEWLCQYIPQIAPKSLSGYTRMKNSNTANFQKIVEAAKARGYIIS